MNEPVTSKMKDFVQARIDDITSDHQKMISEWNGVDLTDENIRHLYNLFSKCSKADIRMFEDVNFRNDNKVIDVITKRLTRRIQEEVAHRENEKSERKDLMESKALKKKKKKKQQYQQTEAVRVIDKPSEPIDTVALEEQAEKVVDSVEEAAELACLDVAKQEPTAPPLELYEEKTAISEASKKNPQVDDVMKEMLEKQEQKAPRPENNEVKQSKVEKAEEDKLRATEETLQAEKSNNEKDMKDQVDEEPREIEEVVKKELCKTNSSQKDIEDESSYTGRSEIERKVAEILQEKRAQKAAAQQLENDQREKRRNPFDNDHFIIEPLIDNKAKPKDDMDEKLEILDRLPGHYINPESNNLKNDLHRLATDISTQEKNMRARLNSGEPTNMDGGVLADFISRANTVLKETEAVTVRKIAEAETKKFFSTNPVQPGLSMETISNELMQDIWPKSNKWRCIARAKNGIEVTEEVDPKTRKKQDDQIARAVQAAIKSAGEPLDKKQIGRIRKAAILYRDFDATDQKELDFRSDQTAKLVEYVSAYEATNRMDDLTRLRLAIAFCTKRRDYFLKARPPNFMQFSYMYIYLLEKLNSKTAAICACLNYQSAVSSQFDVLEELLLNLFHEDYFLGCIDD